MKFLEFESPQGKAVINVERIVALVDITKGNPKDPSQKAYIEQGVRCQIYTDVKMEDHYNCIEYYVEVRDRLEQLEY